MNETVQLGPWGAIASLVMFLGTVVGLVVWLVKSNMRRQEKVTDRAMTFMEKQLESQATIHQRHADALLVMANNLADHSNELKRLTSAIAKLGEKT